MPNGKKGSGPGKGDGTGRGTGRGRMGGGRAAGPGGECRCTSCGTTALHQRGVPCYEQTCPKCGKPMVRA